MDFEVDKRVEEYPFIERLVSSNIHPMDDQHQDPAAYVIRELTLKRGAPGRTVRIGIVGFSEAKPTGPNMKESVYAGFRIDDPFEAARKIQFIPATKDGRKVSVILQIEYHREIY